MVAASQFRSYVALSILVTLTLAFLVLNREQPRRRGSAAHDGTKRGRLGMVPEVADLQVVNPTKSDWDDSFMLQEPIPTFPPRPVLPTGLPDGASRLRLTRRTALSKEDYLDIRRTIHCWSWFGNWVKQENATDGIGYRFIPDPRCPAFEPAISVDKFCDATKGRPLLLVGDSITKQHWVYLNTTFGNNRPLPEIPEIAKTWDPWIDADAAEHTKDLPYRYGACTDTELRFSRADRLLLDSDPTRILEFDLIDTRWTEAVKGFKGIMILNRGAHAEIQNKTLNDLRLTFSYLRGAAPDALLFFRLTPPGHINCEAITEPLKEPQQGELPHGWHNFWNQNRLNVDLMNEGPSLSLPSS